MQKILVEKQKIAEYLYSENQIIIMRGRASGHDFVDPMIIKILKESKSPMSMLGINYRVNNDAGRTINLNVIRDHLLFLVKSKKVSERLDKENGVTYYKLVQ